MDEETTYSLAILIDKTINGIKTLTPKEFKDTSQKIEVLEEFQIRSKLYDLITLNYQDLQEKIVFYRDELTERGTISFHKRAEQFIDLNRLILNLLSSIRTYLDHNETLLKRKYGGNSVEYMKFKELTSKCFDEYFSYRFLYKFRNYTQHCGLPIGSLSVVDDLQGCSLTVKVSKNHLLNDFSSWGSLVEAELGDKESEFDLIPLVEEKVYLLGKINDEITSVFQLRLTEQGTYLLNLMREVIEGKQGTPILIKISGSAESPELEMKSFPYEAISKTTGVNIKLSPAASAVKK